ncbi:uncharacterized protein LOC115440783 isoform X3 [Manduca sexta]|uniref:uncharacterized protein LOC115440783 isoform X3 n=1 Tax=Manduca sexta TaxID=7130 RepID=UPI00188F27AB|nr:uncharacterized protein LOC115440783 isoform X3 [Manduca sexta]
MVRYVFVVLAGLTCAVLCKPLETSDSEQQYATELQPHNIQKRFINPMFNLGSNFGTGLTKLRTKRSYDECERLELCKLHARSHSSFLAAYQLYFVNKENARLWDHQSRTLNDCENRYGDCYKK